MKTIFSKGMLAAAVLGLGLASAAPAFAERNREEPKNAGLSTDKLFGAPNQAELQRGYKVYKEVCSACHSMKLLSFRDLGQKGGPFYSAKYKNPNDNPYVKAIAGEFEVNDIDSETGDTIKRKAVPADRFPSPFPNAEAAAAGNGGAVPPDLSVITKAREGGGDYVFSVLTGYQPAPAGLKLGENQHYNPYVFGDLGTQWTGKGPVPKGGVIAMPPPLAADQVTFDDGTPSTLHNEAVAVASFLTWASDPHATERKQTGVAVLIFLALFGLVTYLSYRRIWKNVGH